MILEDTMNAEYAAEFLLLTFNPAQLMNALQSDPVQIFCDEANFHQVFLLPDGINATAIQSLTCDTIQTGNLVTQQIWDLLDIRQLAEGVLGSLSPSSPALTESPFATLLTQVERFLRNANMVTRLLEAFNRDMPEVSQYVNMLLTTVSTVNSPSASGAGEMCDALVNIIDEYPVYLQMKPYLIKAQISGAIGARIATSLDTIDDFMCDLPSMNISSIMMAFAQSDAIQVSSLIQRFMDDEYAMTADFKCSQLIRDSVIPQERIGSFIESIITKNGSFATCFEKLVTSDFTALEDVNTYLALLRGVQDLINSDGFSSLQWLEPIRPLLNEIIGSTLQQV